MDDFITHWQDKLYRSLRGFCGDETAERITEGREDITADSSKEEIIRWTSRTMQKIADECPEEMLQGILTACSCPYPRSKLSELRELYTRTGDLDAVIERLQQQLENSLRQGMLFEDEIVDRIKELGWGVAGRREGNRIIITKIPKSGNIRRYFATDDPELRRELYCHCPRVRQAAALGMEVPREYCICGAGYYAQIWESIIGRKVKVRVLESITSGGDTCTFEVEIPEDTDE